MLIRSKHSIIGSTVVYPYDNADYAPVELGASIFVTPNKNLMRAVKEFNLTLLNHGEDIAGAETGIWDGENFVMKVSLFLVLQVHPL